MFKKKLSTPGEKPKKWSLSRSVFEGHGSKSTEAADLRGSDKPSYFVGETA